MDPLAEEAYDWSSYRYAYNNPISYIDPLGLIETKFVTEFGDMIVETDDGCDDVYVVEEENMKSFQMDLYFLVNTDKDNDPEKNAEIGKENGYDIRDMEENANEKFPTDISAETDAAFGMGYDVGYEDNTMLRAVKYFVMVLSGAEERNTGGWNFEGERAGRNDRESGRMNMFNPVIKNDNPIFIIDPQNNSIIKK